MSYKKEDKALDAHTKQYIKNVKRLQWIVLLVVAIAFVLFSHTVISNNKENLKKVALAEVQESMKETVNNIVIYVDGVNTRIYQQAEVQLIDLQNRILDDGIKSTEDLYTYLNVSAENQIGQAIELIYTSRSGKKLLH